MERKIKKKLKERANIRRVFLFANLVVLLIIMIGIGYVIHVGDRYEFHTSSFGHTPESIKNITYRCEPEGVIRVEDPIINEEGETLISIVSEKPGDVHFTVYWTIGDRQSIKQTDFHVTFTGTILEHGSYRFNFSGSPVVTYLFLGIMAVELIGMLYAFWDCYKRSDYSYAMVTYGGVALYIGALLLIVTYKLQNNVINYFSDLSALLTETGQWFLIMLLIPMLILAAALSISNIRLMRHEGYRPVNALGIVISLVWYLVLAWTLNIGLPFSLYIPAASQTWATLRSIIRYLMTFVITYFECLMLSTSVCAFISSRHTPPYDRDYIIILGCAIRKDGSLTPLLKGRADAALRFEKEQYEKTGKHACFVPSGGQGSDEVISEGEAMERYLIEQGIEPERILREDKSTNTFENMQFSRDVIERDAGDISQKKTAFSTTNYHVFRGYILSEKNGFKAQGISAKTKWYFFPNAFIREFIGLIVDRLWRHIVTVALMIVFLLIFALI